MLHVVRGHADDAAVQLTCDKNAGDGIEVLHCHARKQVAGTNFAKVAQHRFLPRGACSCLCARARGHGQAAARAGPHLQRFQQQRPCDILRWARARGLQRIVPDDLDHKVAVLEAYHVPIPRLKAARGQKRNTKHTPRPW